MAKYRVTVNPYTQDLRKQHTDPFTLKRHSRGDEITLTDPEEVRRLTEGGAIEPLDGPSSDPSAPSVAPGTGGGAGFSGTGPALTPEAAAEVANATAVKPTEKAVPSKAPASK